MTFDLLPVGAYEFEILTAVPDKSANGYDMAKLYVEVLDGPQEGREVYTQLVKTDQNLRGLIAQLEAAGITAEWMRSADARWSEVVALLPGRRFRAEVHHTEWPVGSGRMRNDFGKWRPAA